MGQFSATRSDRALALDGVGMPVELMQATATHGGSNLAIATGRIDDESDGFFALDYTTGDLKCWVYNARFRAFTGMFASNVTQFLGSAGKNPEYLLVTGRVDPPPSNTTSRAAAVVVWIVDVKMGQFVAFEVPWDRSVKNTGALQTNPLVPIGGDYIRPPMAAGAVRKPPPGKDGANPANPNDPNAPANPARNNNNNNNKNN